MGLAVLSSVHISLSAGHQGQTDCIILVDIYLSEKQGKRGRLVGGGLSLQKNSHVTLGHTWATEKTNGHWLPSPLGLTTMAESGRERIIVPF